MLASPLAVVLVKILGVVVAAGIYVLSQVPFIKGGGVEQTLIGLAGFLVGSVLVQFPPTKSTPSQRPPAPPVGPAVGMLVLAFVLAGCAGPFEETRAARTSARAAAAPPSSRCVELDNRYASWGAIAKGAVVVSGASGIATVPAKSDGLKTGLAITSVAAAALGASAIFVSEAAATSWARECSP